MRKSVRIVITLGSVMIMALALNLGVAFADHPGGTEWTCDESQGGDTPCLPGDRNPIGPAAENALAPIGSHIPAAAFVNGFGSGDPTNPAVIAVTNNPLCPFHDVTP